MAFPLIVIAMALMSAVDNSVASVIIAIGISMLTLFLRMVRSYAKTECVKIILNKIMYMTSYKMQAEESIRRIDMILTARPPETLLRQPR